MKHNSSKDLVSIITPSYNSSSTIKRCIISVINQTYSNWELLITDDCSLDETIDIIKQFHDERIKVYCLSENSGAAIARNNSLAHCNGDFIAFLDSDDEWHPEKLFQQLNFMKKKNADFSYTSYFRISIDGLTTKKVKIKPKTSFNQLLKNTQIYTSTVILSRRAFKKLEMPIIRRRQDFAFWLTLLKEVPYAFGLNTPYTSYYETPNSLSSNYRKSIYNTYLVYRQQFQYSRIKSYFFLVNYIFNAIKKRLF